jgi:dTDP-4-dehydrorhamnose reductase
VKILITGGSGIIGSKLVQSFDKKEIEMMFTFNKNKFNHKNSFKLDITKKNQVENCISKFNPDIVIHSAAMTNVDYCEKNQNESNEINIKGTENIIEACKKSNSQIIFISTAYVFDGEKKSYVEEDIPNPINHYGFTKLQGENAVKKSGLNYLILRTDQPYDWAESWQKKNSVIRVVETLSSKKSLNEIIDWKNTPTYIPDFINATKKLLELKKSGIYHVVGPDFVNRYEWSCIVSEEFGLEKKRISTTTSDSLNILAKRGNINLSAIKLQKETNLKLKGIREGAKEMFLTMPEKYKV